MEVKVDAVVADEGESNKQVEIGDLMAIDLTKMDEVPSVETLKNFSNARLFAAHVHQCWVDHGIDEDLLVKSFDGGASKEVQVLHEEFKKSEQFLENLLKAQNTRCPVVPDDRPIGWVGVGDKVNLCLIECDDPRTLLPATGIVTKVEASDSDRISPGTIMVKVDNHEDIGWSEEESYYDLCSPYILVPEDVEYFRKNPIDLRKWLKECGRKYPYFLINDGLQRAFINLFDVSQ